MSSTELVRGNNPAKMQHALDDLDDRIDALYGKFSGLSLLKELEQEHSEEVVAEAREPKVPMSLLGLRL